MSCAETRVLTRVAVAIEAQAAEELIAKRMAAFRLGQRDHDALLGSDDWARFRARIDDAIEALRR